TKLILQFIPLLGSLPVASYKHFIKFFIFPSIEFIHSILDNYFIYISYLFQYFYSFLKLYNWLFIFSFLCQLICSNPNYQKITIRFGIFKNIQMPYMKKIKYACRIAYDSLFIIIF